jgi:putative ABC transport system permease protein
MRPFLLAWRTLTRQPARAVLGVAGIAIVGALLFDMLLLSRGLAVSFRDLLEDTGFDVRVTANQWVPSRGPMIGDGTKVLAELRALEEIEDVVPARFGRAHVVLADGDDLPTDFMGVGGEARGTWTVFEGESLPVKGNATDPAILVNRFLAERMNLSAGDSLRLRGACDSRASAMPATVFTVVGVVDFRFEIERRYASVTTLDQFARTCALTDPDAVTLFMAASRHGFGPADTVRAIARVLPDLHAFTNQEFVDRMQATDFSYFRQVSFALATITLFFAFLLIATLLTVSVNQRLGEVAALRALGFRRRRVIADLIWESVLLVGAGGLLALPLGGLLAARLDAILREMPGIPMNLHFFVFQPRAAIAYVALLAAAGVLAAAYPVYLAARLPIAATLRREVVS